jgi:acyl-CoA dehydrogenase
MTLRSVSARRGLCRDPRQRAAHLRRLPGAYWRELEERGLPDRVRQALTEAGYLAALIPEEYGGAGLPLRAAGVILEEINASGCNAGAAHAQMYIMGTLLRHGSAAQKRVPAEIASRAAAPAGLRRDRADHRHRHHQAEDPRGARRRHYVVNGQKVWTSRALHSDLMLLLARTTPVEQVKRKTDGLSVFLVDMREAVGKGMTIRPIKAMINHNTTEVFFDNLRIPADSLIGEEGKGFRYILDGMNAERILVSPRVDRRRQAGSLKKGASTPMSAGVRPADRAEPGRAVPDRARLRPDGGGRS